MMKKLSKIMSEIEASKDTDEQIARLRMADSRSLRDVLTYMLHPHVEWKLPDTDPPYKPLHEASDAEGRLYAETKMFQYFTNTAEGLKVKQIERERLFISLLESLDPEDAAFMLKLRFKTKHIGISRKVVDMALPDLTKGWPSA